MTNTTLNKLRNVEIEILDEFVKICVQNNLNYFIDGGTLLGAARHRGFIPWDDDIDVAMPRKDYERLLELLHKSQFNSDYYMLSYKSFDNTVLRHESFSKFCKKGTVFAETGTAPHNYSGIYIDIFPFDNCVLFFLPLQTFIIKFLGSILRIKNNTNTPKKRSKRILGKFLSFFFPVKITDLLFRKSHLLFNKKGTKYISFFSGKYHYKKETHRVSEIFPCGEILFEGKNYRAPNNWNSYLKILYGDNYMELPPVEKRVTHAPGFISFDEHDF